MEFYEDEDGVIGRLPQIFREQEEEEIAFSQIPKSVQLNVIEKLKYKDFATFNRCNKESVELCSSTTPALHDFDISTDFIYTDKVFQGMVWNKRRLLKIKINTIPRRLVFHRFLRLGDLTQSSCEFLHRLLLEQKIRILHGIEVRQIKCDPMLFQEFLAKTCVRKMILSNGVDCDYSKLPEIQKADYLVIKRGHNVTHMELLQFQASHLEIFNCRVSTIGLVQFFKQWIEGSRYIEFVELSPTEPLDEVVIKTILSDNCEPSNEVTMKLWRIGPFGLEKISVFIMARVVIQKC